MAGRQGEIGIAIYEGWCDQALIDIGLLETFFGQRTRVDFAQHRPAYGVAHQGKDQRRPLALIFSRFGCRWHTRRIHEDQRRQLTWVRQGVVPGHATAHRISGQSKAINLEHLGQLIDDFDLAIGGDLIACWHSRQAVCRQVQADDPVVVPQASHPRLPGIQIGREAMHHDDRRAGRIALIAIVQCHPVGQGRKPRHRTGVLGLERRIGDVARAAG